MLCLEFLKQNYIIKKEIIKNEDFIILIEELKKRKILKIGKNNKYILRYKEQKVKLKNNLFFIVEDNHLIIFGNGCYSILNEREELKKFRKNLSTKKIKKESIIIHDDITRHDKRKRIFKKLKEKIYKSGEREFGLMGFVRGGTHYIANVFQSFGFNVLHEKPEGKDGICDCRLVLFMLDKVFTEDSNLIYPVEQDIQTARDKIPDTKTALFYCKYQLEDYYKIKDYKNKLFFIRNPWHILSTWIQIYDYPYSGGIISNYVYYSEKYNFYSFENKYDKYVSLFLEYFDWMKKASERIILVEDVYYELKKYFIEKEIEHINITKDELDAGTSRKNNGVTRFTKKRIPKEEILKKISKEKGEELLEVINSLNTNKIRENIMKQKGYFL